MFPFQRSCELSFKISDEGDQNEQTNNEDQITLDNNASVGLNNDSNNANPGRGRGRGRGQGRILSSSSLAGTSSNTNANNDEHERKIIHREYERQRRQEMATLYNSLRLNLPPEYIQGKRSISDHVEEAINYIKHLKNNVKELEEKKYLLEQSVESTSSTSEFGESSNSAGVIGSVVIRQSMVGLQIDISVGYEDEGFSLSNALQVVIDEGLEVVSCTSTKFNDRLIHNLQCQVRNTNTTSIDVNRLQQRLSDLVS